MTATTQTAQLVNGSCFCRQVTYQFSGDMGIFQYCHCSRCRKFTGSAYAPNLFVEPRHFRWLSGETFVKHYIPEDTKYFCTCFCSQCGSSLPWLSKNKRVMVVPAGTLDDMPATKPQQNIHYASKADWHICPCQLVCYDKLPIKK